MTRIRELLRALARRLALLFTDAPESMPENDRLVRDRMADLAEKRRKLTQMSPREINAAWSRGETL